MKSKQIYILPVLALLLVSSALYGQKVKISRPVYANEKGSLEVAMHIEASGLEVNCGGGYRLEIYIENGDTRLLLPEVMYYSHTRSLYEERRERLSGIYTPEPYETFDRVKKNRTYKTDYRVSVPYYSWMEDATVKYGYYACECRGDLLLAEGPLVDLKQPEPEIREWLPEPEVYRAMTQFLVPEVEQVKSRNEMLRLNLEFPVNIYEIRPDHANNRHELGKVEQLMATILDKKLVTVRSMHITGYASPEGKFNHNEFLAKNRSIAFERYIKANYGLAGIPVRTSWVAEDWDGLEKALDTAVYLPTREKVRGIIAENRHRDPDSREWLLKKLDNQQTYRNLLKNIYPGLRRIELDVDYVISNFTDADARELIFTRPELLSLNEIFRVALLYEEGSENYKRVYQIAAQQYPNAVIANNNVAAVLLRTGEAAAAFPYLLKIADDPRAFVNIGVYYYIAGDLKNARSYFARAAEAGFEQGTENLRLLQERE